MAHLPQVGQSFRVGGPEDVKTLERLAASGSLEGDVLLDACEWKVRRGEVLQGGKLLEGDVLLDVHGTGLQMWRRHCLSTKGFRGACAAVKGKYIASVAANSVCVTANGVFVTANSVCV